MDSASPKKEGRRERKRLETLRRIAETGLKLFIAHGYEGTTLEAIAEAAGISRRTFFYYFKSKEEVLLAWQGAGLSRPSGPPCLKNRLTRSPLDAVRHCLLKLISRYETQKAPSSSTACCDSYEALRARKQAVYVDMEQALLGAMCELWPEPKRRASL